MSISKRSSWENMYFFSGFTEITTSISSNKDEARFITSKCPNVGGSKEPANTAFTIISILTYLTNASNRWYILYI